VSVRVPAREYGGLRRQLPYLSVLVVAGTGIAYSLLDTSHWLRGVGVVGLSLLLAGALRLTLSDDGAGLLAVRRRAFDVACYWALAAAIIGVGNALPH
jgi:hypothetical protein